MIVLSGVAGAMGSMAAALASEGGSRTIDTGTWTRFLEARHSYEIHCAPCHGLEGAAGLSPYAPAFALDDGLKAELAYRC